jgi:hypothetical protein
MEQKLATGLVKGHAYGVTAVRKVGFPVELISQIEFPMYSYDTGIPPLVTCVPVSQTREAPNNIHTL